MVNEWLIAIRARQPDWIEKRLIPRHDLTPPPPKQVRRAEARCEIMSEIAPDGFRSGLREMGFVEGQNVAIDFHCFVRMHPKPRATRILAAGKPRVSLLVQLFQIGQTVHRQLLGIALTGGGEAFDISGNSLPWIGNVVGIKRAHQLVGAQNAIDEIIHNELRGLSAF
jgi:hypothetical protein